MSQRRRARRLEVHQDQIPREELHDRFTVETPIDRPVGEMFAYAIDPDQLAGWQTNTVSARHEAEEPYGVGSRCAR